MSIVSVVYHSGFGHTKVIAESVAKGAESVEGTTVHLISVDEFEANVDLLNGSDAIIFGAPTYMGSLSAPFKTFMDATGNLWYQGLWKDKIAAGFTNSGSQAGDKLNSLIQLAIFAAQHGMIWVGLDLKPGNITSTGSTEDLNRIGSWLRVASQSNNDQGPDVAPPASDKATAEYLGRRVAEQTLRIK